MLKEQLLISFNSKMVRLKALRMPSNWPQNDSFNSKMVRLKVCLTQQIPPIKACFNSKMVRLKAMKHLKKLLLLIVSIPKWYD